ncbi:MAG: purple acid phosphatase [archaeon]|nr:purple acid phosphatase [archaeon]
MINIPRDSVIYYVCSNGSSSSPVNQFRSPASQSVPTRFAALGDQGTFYPVGFKVAEQIAQLPALDMVLHAGDLCYAGTSGSSSGQEIEEIWDYWGRQNQQFSAKVPYMLTVGNHEQFYNFTSFIHRFHMPQNGVGSFLYSYDVGFFHVLSFSSEQSYTPGTEQYNFIVNDLQQASQNLVQVPWIVVVDHRPFYCSDQGEYEAHNGDPSTSTLSKYLEPLFVQYRVNLVINGHMHVFERSLPVFNATSPYTAGDDHYTTKIAPPVYITVGSGGIFLDWKWIDPQPSWSAYRASEWGVAVVEANATTLHYQFQTTLGRQIKDEFWISNL